MPKKPIKHGQEIRATDPSTGGQKGRKTARHSLIPPEFLHEIAELFGRGAEKYNDWNWRKGYNWSDSYDAMHRHLNLFWSGVDMDHETKAKHVTNAAWHCIVLAIFMDEHPELDDRYKDPEERTSVEEAKKFAADLQDPDDYMRRP